MSGKSIFTWVHLSDIHATYKDYNKSSEQGLVLDELRNDVPQFADSKDLHPDAVFITGDIANSGGVKSSHEYAIAGEWIDKVITSLGVDKQNTFLVPGNHDVQRYNKDIQHDNTDEDTHTKRLVDNLREGKEKLDTALGNESDRSLLYQRIQSYTDLASTYGPSDDKADGFAHSIAPRSGHPVKIVCLNTALLCNDEEDCGKLQVGLSPLNQAFTSTVQIGHEIVFVLTHHPWSWLRDGRNAEEWVRRHAHLHLYGHMHENDTSKLITGGGREIVSIRSGAAYTNLESPSDVSNLGYGLGSIHVDENGKAFVRHWPRIWSPKNKDFRTDTSGIPDNKSFSEMPLHLKVGRQPQPKYSGGSSEDIYSAYRCELQVFLDNSLILDLYNNQDLRHLCVEPLVVNSGDTDAQHGQNLHALLGERRSVILGVSGSGKTTALRKLALDLLQTDMPTFVPVYISLASSNLDFVHGGKDDFVNYIDSELSLLGRASLEKLQNACAGEIVLLLDGWDELYNDEACQRVKRFLVETDYRFVITSRPEAQRGLPSAPRYEMLPLSGPRVIDFLRRRIQNSRTVDNLLQWLKTTPGMLRLAENPLNLSIIAIVFSDTQNLMKMSRTKLYKSALAVVLKQHHRENPFDGVLSSGEDQSLQMDEMLENLAYDSMVNGHGRFFSDRQFNQSAVKIFGMVPNGLKTLLTGRLGIIRDRKAGRLEFFHLWYQEFLTARRIVEQSGDISTAMMNPKLRSALPYVIGQIDDPDQAYRILLELDKPDPFNYCRAILEGDFTESQIDGLLAYIISEGEERVPKIPVRIELAKALAEAGMVAVDGLFRALRNKELNDYTRRAALEALAILPVDPDRFETAAMEVLNTDSLGLLWHLIEHLGRRKVSSASNELTACLTHQDAIVAGDAAWALNEIQDSIPIRLAEEIVDRLFDALECDDKHRQGHALRTLGRLRISRALPKLEQHLKKSNSGYRWIVPESAAMIGGPLALNILALALKDDDKQVVAAALVALAEIDTVIPEKISKQIENHIGDDTWIISIESSLGAVAAETYETISQQPNPSTLAHILVCRHCKTEYTTEKRLQGIRDIPLSDDGRKQACENMSSIENLGIDLILSSPLKRAKETAQLYSEHLGVPLTIDHRLSEIDHGDWQGYEIDDLKINKDTGYSQWLADPLSITVPAGSETILEVERRMRECVADLVRTQSQKTIAIMTHKHARAVLMCSLFGQELTYFSDHISEDIGPKEIPPEMLPFRENE